MPGGGNNAIFSGHVDYFAPVAWADAIFRGRGVFFNLNVLSPGDVFGEMAFLLEQPRTADVYAATNGRILSLSEGTLRKSIKSDPEIAATLLLNISKILCMRLLKPA